MKTSFSFDEPREQSLIKTEIVAKYFWAWATALKRVMERLGKKQIAYVDLFCGPGIFDDGTPSTPVEVVQKAIDDEDIRNKLLMWFNDGNSDHTARARQAIESLPGVERLAFRPMFSSHDVAEDIDHNIFRMISSIPTLMFLDPCGYRGLSLDLISSTVKGWGCECIVFFNYNRINAAINNPMVDKLIDGLFGMDAAEALRQKLVPLSPSEREATIVEAMAQAIKGQSVRYVLPFRFQHGTRNRTSHYLIFVSKNQRGYEIMKDVMANRSTSATDGVPSFDYCSADARQPLLFGLSRPIEDLEQSLLNTFAGQTLNFKDIFERHNVDTPYVEKNYKDALRHLESSRTVVANPEASRRHKRGGVVTFGEKVLVTFPPR